MSRSNRWRSLVLALVLAAVLQSALFALAHNFGAMHAAFAFGLGLSLTAVYAWRKTLVAPIFVHAGNNLFAAAMMLLLPIWALSITMEPMPTSTLSSITHPCTIALCPILTLFPIVVPVFW